MTMSKAVLWTDGRYHLQADEQLDCKWTIMKEGREDVRFGFFLFSILVNYFPETKIILHFNENSGISCREV